MSFHTNSDPVSLRKARITTIITLFAFLFSAFWQINTLSPVAKAESISEDATDEVCLYEEEVIEALAYALDDKALQKDIEKQTVLSPTGAHMKSFDARAYSDYTNEEYGGMYIDEKGQLVLCYVENSKWLKKVTSKQPVLMKSDKTIVSDNYRVKAVKYSAAELQRAYEQINEEARRGAEIRTVDIDWFENRLVVGVTGNKALSSVSKALRKMQVSYAVELVDEKDTIQEVATISGTSCIGNVYISSTTAGKMYSLTQGKWCYVTCGHGWSVSNTVYANNQTPIGLIIGQQYNSTNDSSIFTLWSGHSYSDQRRDELDTYLPAVGSKVTLRGYVSGKVSGAKILSTSATITVSPDNLVCTGLIRCNKPMQHGDSGGGAIGRIIDLGRTASIIGINKAADTSNTWLVKSGVIYNAFG